MANLINKVKYQWKYNKKRFILRIMLVLLSLIIISATVVAYQINENIKKMMIPTVEINSVLDPNSINSNIPISSEEHNSDDFFVLVMGLDYRENHDALLTDSLMVMHVNPNESIVKLLSIPRDLLVENSSGNEVKINSLFYEGYALYKKKADQDPSILTGDYIKLGSNKVDKVIFGGAMANTRYKIEQLLNITLQHTFVVNFNTVVSLIDEVDGIEIDVKRSMQYKATNLYLKPGVQILDGEAALGYARFREDDRGTRYYASDYERGQHQQEVVKALASKILSWKNSTKALKLLEIVSDNVQTDMNYSDMFSIITKYYDDFNGDSFISIPFPEQYSADGDVIISNQLLETLQDSIK